MNKKLIKRPKTKIDRIDELIINRNIITTVSPREDIRKIAMASDTISDNIELMLIIKEFIKTMENG